MSARAARWRRRLALAAAAAVVALVGWSAFRATLYDVGALARRVPARTAVMEQRAAEARRKGRRVVAERRWVSLERISPILRHAVLAAEDSRYYTHGGVDWEEVQASARRNLKEHRIARGGSTITQQLAKNVFLGAQRTPTRKLTELFLALRMESELRKRRIFELYLNLIEWGDGVYGAEAASRHWFGKPAAGLSPREAVLLAAVIINPRRYSPVAPVRRIERRVRMIAGRMRRQGWLSEAQYRQAIGAPAVADTTAAPTESTGVAADSELVMPRATPAGDTAGLSLPAPP